MSRIKDCLDRLRNERRTALVPYITAGDPEPGVTRDLMTSMVAAGADILELGVPFSDPMADGPVIQAACERALEHGTSLTDVLDLVREFRAWDNSTPVVLMGYLNPIEVMGYEAFAKAASDAGVDGVLMVDLPPEEAVDVQPFFVDAGLDIIFLAAPTSNDERIEKIVSVGSGFIYYVSVKGVTGSAALDVEAVAENVSRIRQHTDLPVGVGFGIHDAASAAAVAQVADAVVVGSAIVKRIAANVGQTDNLINEVTSLLAGMRQAMDKVSAE